MSTTERAITFECAHEPLAGILTVPAIAAHTGVIVVVGGPQYRVGSHRQFVLLSRALATGGYPVLRFDYRGMGDSCGAQRDFLQVTADIAAAIDAMQEQLPAVKRVVLWGLCDGASAALLYWRESGDARIEGMCLLNPWVRSEASLAQTHVKHYYRDRLRQKEFWIKLLSGKVAFAAVGSLWRNLRAMSSRSTRSADANTQSFQDQMAAACREFSGRVLFLLSEDDYVAKEFIEYARTDAVWSGLLERPGFAVQELAGADHTLSAAACRVMAEELTLRWLTSNCPSGASPETLG